jgi:hypothetical protein
VFGGSVVGVEIARHYINDANPIHGPIGFNIIYDNSRANPIPPRLERKIIYGERERVEALLGGKKFTLIG